MSWSLEVANGDLTLGGHGLGTVTGGTKLVQDLRCGLLEPMGTDNLHPSFGSTIDGGVLPDGTYAEGIIGHPNDSYAAAFIEAEIRRVANQYQAQQQDRYQSDVATYGKGTLTADEALMGVESVITTPDQNRLGVDVTLQTGTGSLPLSIMTGDGS